MINASVVLYKTSIADVKNIVGLLRACKAVDKIWLIDNSEIQTEAFIFMPVDYIFNNKNLGYGRGHNIAIEKSLCTDAKYHLVINSDIDFAAGTLEALIDYMDKNEDVGQCMPMTRYQDGRKQHLAKLLPSPLDLFLRRFMPKSWIHNRNHRFELHDAPANTPINVPFLSGCFMLFRTDVLRDVGMFDPRYFMYLEDVDMTRRIHRKYRTMLYPKVSIIHQYTQGSYHNFNLFWRHTVSMCRYFNKWGWIFDSEKRQFNRETLNSIKKK